MLARSAVQTWPWLFFPNWNLGVYVAASGDPIDLAAAANAQWNMTATWLAGALLSLLVWIGITWNARRVGPRAISLCAVGAVIAMLLFVADWLFFTTGQLGLFKAELGRHLGRTVYTNSQNAIVVGWWIGALLVAAIQRDRHTLVASSVVGVGFGIGFPLAAVWTLGYAYAPGLIDWWKIWELQSGFHLGLLYAAVLYWAIRNVDQKCDASRTNNVSMFRPWCETLSMAVGVLLFVYVMARELFLAFGVWLGSMYAVALLQATRCSDGGEDRRRGVSLVYSVFLLVFILTSGASSQVGILLGLYDAKAADQYAWPTGAWCSLRPPVSSSSASQYFDSGRQRANQTLGSRPSPMPRALRTRIVDLMTLAGVVGAASIWPAKIGVLYACFLGLALFAFNRMNRCFDSIDALVPSDG